MGLAQMESRKKENISFLPFLNVRAAFGLSCQVDDLKPIIRVLIVIGVLLAIALLVIPTVLVISLDSKRKVEVNDLHQEIEKLHQELKVLREFCQNTEDKVVRLQQIVSNEIPTSSNIADDEDEEEEELRFPLETHGEKIRKKRSRKTGGKPKRDVIVRQFRGEDNEYVESENRLNGYVGNWIEERWLSNGSSLKTNLDNKGEIVVTDSGIYLVTVQLTFANYKESGDFSLQLLQSEKRTKNVNVSKCFIPQGESYSHTCTSTVFLCLNKGDKLGLYVGIRSVALNLEKSSSIIGMYRVAKLPSCSNEALS